MTFVALKTSKNVLFAYVLDSLRAHIQNMEFEEVTLKLPKQLMTFLRAIEQTLDGTIQEFLEESLVDTVHAQLRDETLLTPSWLMEKFKLKPIFEATN